MMTCYYLTIVVQFYYRDKYISMFRWYCVFTWKCQQRMKNGSWGCGRFSELLYYASPHYFPAVKAFPVDTFHLQRMKEAFHTGIVITVAFRTHTATQVVSLQQRLIIP